MDEETFAELRRLELRLMDPAVRHDREHVALLLADDFVEFGSSGYVWTRDSSPRTVGNRDLRGACGRRFPMQDARRACCTRNLSRGTHDGDGRTRCHAAKFTVDEEVGKLENVFPPGDEIRRVKTREARLRAG